MGGSNNGRRRGLARTHGNRYESVAMIADAARGPGGAGSSPNGGGDVYRKLVFDGDRLVGAVFAGRVDRAGVYRSFIETGLPLSRTLRAAAEEGTLTYADVQMRGQKPPYGNYVSA